MFMTFMGDGSAHKQSRSVQRSSVETHCDRRRKKQGDEEKSMEMGDGGEIDDSEDGFISNLDMKVSFRGQAKLGRSITSQSWNLPGTLAPGIKELSLICP